MEFFLKLKKIVYNIYIFYYNYILCLYPKDLITLTNYIFSISFKIERPEKILIEYQRRISD